MRISCPECHTHYRVDASNIAETGRRVRCGKCKHTWMYVPGEDVMDDPIERLQADLMSAIMLSTVSRVKLEVVD